MAGIFLDASILQDKEMTEVVRYNVQQARIRFKFPSGFEKLRLIEECRALNALDLSNPDNFDFMYDITMQMLVGKPVVVCYVDEMQGETELGKFVVTDRYMDLRGVGIIDEYPVLVNWLVEFVSVYLLKKFPRSLKSFQARMSEREEHLKSLKK